MTEDTPPFRFSSLSPLSLIVAAGFGFWAVKLPGTIEKIEALEADLGVQPAGVGAWLGSGWAVVAIWAFVVLIIAKDWRISSERGRVWANLGCLAVGSGLVAALGSRLSAAASAL